LEELYVAERIDLRELRWKVVDWIHPTHDMGPDAGSCQHGDEPLGSAKQLLDYQKGFRSMEADVGGGSLGSVRILSWDHPDIHFGRTSPKFCTRSLL